MKVRVKKVEGLKLVGESASGHSIVIDTKKEVGGFESAPSPMEYLLMACGACTLMDVISILDKMKVNYKEIEIEVEGKRKEEHPKYFEEIKLNYILKGENIEKEKVEKAINLSLEKYCSVSNNLKPKTKIIYNIEIKKGE
ncbi:MAG: OsmC family protein [candidate division WOR-3 bacterium]